MRTEASSASVFALSLGSYRLQCTVCSEQKNEDHLQRTAVSAVQPVSSSQTKVPLDRHIKSTPTASKADYIVHADESDVSTVC